MTDSEKLNLLLSDMQGMKADIQKLEQRVTNIELHLENLTDKNIQLLVKNIIELTDRFNQSIPIADKNLAYKIEMNYLVDKVDNLKQDIAMIKNKTA